MCNSSGKQPGESCRFVVGDTQKIGGCFGGGGGTFEPYVSPITPYTFDWSSLKQGTFAFGKQVACEPFKDQSVKQVQKGGLITTQKHGLTPLRVIYGNEQITAGCLVYVRGDAYATPWGKQTYNLVVPATPQVGSVPGMPEQNIEFILVPEDQVVLVWRG